MTMILKSGYIWFVRFFQIQHRSSTDRWHRKKIHLQSLLRGEAAQLISGYDCNRTCYETALLHLKDWVGNPLRIVKFFLDRINSIRSPGLNNRKIYISSWTFLSTLVDTFKELDFVHVISSTTKLSLVLAKFPSPIRLEWNKYFLMPYLNQILNLFPVGCACMPMPVGNFFCLILREQHLIRVKFISSTPKKNKPNVNRHFYIRMSFSSNQNRN